MLSIVTAYAYVLGAILVAGIRTGMFASGGNPSRVISVVVTLFWPLVALRAVLNFVAEWLFFWWDERTW